MNADELKDIYLKVDADLLAGRKKYEDLTAKEVAGLWICRYGSPQAALSSLRIMTGSRLKNVLRKWPGFKEELEEAWRTR